MVVGIAYAIAPSDVGAEVVVVGVGGGAAVEGHHVGPYLEGGDAVGIVDDVRCISAAGTHVHLQRHEVAHLAQAAVGLVETEELQVDESRLHTEGLHGAAAPETQVFRHVTFHIIGAVEILVHNVGNAGREDAHRLRQRFALGVDDGIVGADVAGDKLLDDVAAGIGGVLEKVFELCLVLQLMGTSGSDAYIGLGEERVSGIFRKAFYGLQSF